MSLHRLLLPVGSFLAGVVLWCAWLSWGFEDRQYSTFQVLGCGLSAVLVTVVRVWAWTTRPFLFVSGPVALGLTVAWTVWALGDDDSGLAGVGAIMMFIGTTLGLGAVEAIARTARRSFTRSRH